jgi:uncharacterized protein YndB with AHSA1/START domain
MKWLLYILGGIAGLLVVCVLVLLALGMRSDVNRLQASAIIHRPPDQVWPYLYEGDKLKLWVTWLKDVQRDPGPPQVGRTQVWTMEDMNNGGMLMKINSTINAVEPNRSLAVKLSVPGEFQGSAEYRLTRLGDGATKVESDSRYQFNNWIANLMMPLVIHEAHKKAVSDLDRLRAAVESAPVVEAAK